MEGVGRSALSHKGEAVDNGRARGSSTSSGKEVTEEAGSSGGGEIE